MKKSKFEYEMDEFNKAFENCVSKRIVIYGTGRMTATLIEYNDRFNIVGLCDRDASMIGSLVYAVPVISKEEAEANADLVVINTGSSYWNTIYKRIKDWKIPVYYRNGQKAELEVTNDANNPYWESSVEELCRAIDKNEIISFDIFDTLIMRKVMSPLDVFKIVEVRLKKILGDRALSYIEARKIASTRLDNPSLEELFEEVRKIAGWTNEEANIVMNLEFEVERSLVSPRKIMVDLCNKLLESPDKEVFFVSDMYYSAFQIRELLALVGINASEDRIIVSCDKGVDKASGSLWKWYKENVVKEKKAIHIGDNVDSDVKRASEYGLASYWIMSAQDLLEHSSIKEISSRVISLNSSITLGCISSVLFNNPFSLCKSKGKVVFNENEVAGYALLGGIAYDFSVWLANRAKEDGVLNLGFFARDGYLMKEQYDFVSGLFQNYDWPESFYIEISRRAIWGAGAVDTEGVARAAKFPYNGNAYDFLLDRFGIKTSEDYCKMEISDIQKDENAYLSFLLENESLIIERGLFEKRNYLKYLSKLPIEEKTGVVDSSLYGSTQYYLQKLLDKRFHGYYMCACLDSSNEYIPENNMKGCFQKSDDLSGKKCAMNRFADFTESFYTAPNGMILHADEEGNIVYGKEMSNQLFFDVRREMEKGILAFCSDVAKLYVKNELDIYDVDPLFADELLSVFMHEGFEPTDDMKKGFFYDNGIMHHKESPIWG